MNYTSNHHLPQWNESDRVLMQDFNQMNKNLETSLNTAVSKADAAQSAANAAQAAAAAAQAKANAAYSPDNLPYVIGSYVGSTNSKRIVLGWMPSFVIVSGITSSSDVNDNSSIDHYFAIVGGNGTILNGQIQYRLQIASDGFIVFQQGNQGTYLPILNEAGRLYYYIAFR